jgi:hypothetical protein
MAQAVSGWPLAEEAQVRARSVRVVFLMDKVALRLFTFTLWYRKEASHALRSFSDILCVPI